MLLRLLDDPQVQQKIVTFVSRRLGQRERILAAARELSIVAVSMPSASTQSPKPPAPIK
jgi:hypothetical protein